MGKQIGYNTVTKNEEKETVSNMKKRILSALLSLAVVIGLTGYVSAEGGPKVALGDIDTAIEMRVEPELYNGSTYVPYMYVVRALYPNAKATWENGGAMVRDTGLELFMQPGASYIVCNGRYLYTPDKLHCSGGEVMVPLRVLCKALGAEVEWDEATSTAIVIPGTGPIASGDDFYDADTLYWLSHIINAESGNQSLVGKIAVGNVVMNRVASPIFPNDIYSVLYQKNQFTPAMTGSIKRTPNAESVVAAKLVLEGVNVVGESLFFVNPRYAPNSWASRNRPYVTTIGAHTFFA